VCGRPLVALINDEGADIIKESKAGFAMEAGDYKSLSDRVLEMYRMPEEKLKLMADSGKKYYFDNFNRNVLIENVIHHFNSNIRSQNLICDLKIIFLTNLFPSDA
jgi:colanic acid biosynthesis glycosyl transferase WcaI